MAKIKNLKVKVSYTVHLEDVEVSDHVLKSMMDLYILGSVNSDYPILEVLESAVDWIADNIKQDDAMEFESEIEELDI